MTQSLLNKDKPFTLNTKNVVTLQERAVRLQERKITLQQIADMVLQGRRVNVAYRRESCCYEHAKEAIIQRCSHIEYVEKASRRGHSR